MPNLARTNLAPLLATSLLAALTLDLAACRATPSPQPIAGNPAGPTTIRLRADWDDLLAAALVAATKTESAVLGSSAPTPDQAAFEIVSVRDEPVEMTARRLEPPESPGRPSLIELTCRYGRFGDAREQRRFLDAMARRLTDLRGVDYRQVR